MGREKLESSAEKWNAEMRHALEELPLVMRRKVAAAAHGIEFGAFKQGPKVAHVCAYKFDRRVYIRSVIIIAASVIRYIDHAAGLKRQEFLSAFLGNLEPLDVPLKRLVGAAEFLQVAKDEVHA